MSNIANIEWNVLDDDDMRQEANLTLIQNVIEMLDCVYMYERIFTVSVWCLEYFPDSPQRS